MSGNEKRVSHCRACDSFFDTFNRTVEGPNGPLVLEENLCQTCRRHVAFFHDLDDDETLQAKEAAEFLLLTTTGRKLNGSPSSEG